jgi:hypothetical protein
VQPRSLTIAAALAATVTAAALAAGYLTGAAHGLTAIAAVENINATQVPIGASATDSPDATYTTLGSVSLTGGASYVVLANVGLRNTAGAPVTVECSLQAPNEPRDYDSATFSGTRGGALTNLSFMDVAQGLSAGTALLSCRATIPNVVIAHDTRIIAIPVDAVSNNMHTLPFA